MTTLPIPFVVSLLLIMLALVNQGRIWHIPTGRGIVCVLYLNAFTMLLIGVRWTWDITEVLPLVAAISVLIPAIMYLAFLRLGSSGALFEIHRDWPHIAGVCLVGMCSLLFLDWLEFVLFFTKLIYACLFLKLAFQPTYSLQRVGFGWIDDAKKALWTAAALQVIGIIIDIAITLDFALFGGQHAPTIVSSVSVILLLALTYLVISTSQQPQIITPSQGISGDQNSMAPAATRSQPANQNTEQQLNPLNHRAMENMAADEANDVMETLYEVVVRDQLFKNPNLNLQTLGRKTGIPTRTISSVVNKHLDLNISQWVNKARIDAVCETLKDKDISITEAMLEAGFITKSNFNREFKRLKGMSPSQWRETHTDS